MNTLMCVLYDATAVRSFMKAVYDYGTEHDYGHERLAHILVVRHEAMFIIFATAALHTRRLPLDWLLRQGFHTSAVLWLNIKQRSWDERFNGEMGFATRANQRRKTSKAPERTSDMTVTGMHFIAFLHKICRQRPSTAPNPEHSSIAIEGIKAPTPAAVLQQFVHVRPHNVQLTADEDERQTGPCSSTAVDDGWCQKIKAFTDTFKKGYRKKCEADALEASEAAEDAFLAEFVDAQEATDSLSYSLSPACTDDAKCCTNDEPAVADDIAAVVFNNSEDEDDARMAELIEAHEASEGLCVSPVSLGDARASLSSTKETDPDNSSSQDGGGGEAFPLSPECTNNVERTNDAHVVEAIETATDNKPDPPKCAESSSPDAQAQQSWDSHRASGPQITRKMSDRERAQKAHQLHIPTGQPTMFVCQEKDFDPVPKTFKLPEVPLFRDVKLATGDGPDLSSNDNQLITGDTSPKKVPSSLSVDTGITSSLFANSITPSEISSSLIYCDHSAVTKPSNEDTEALNIGLPLEAGGLCQPLIGENDTCECGGDDIGQILGD